MSDKIEAKIDLTKLFTATITLHEAHGLDDDKQRLQPRIFDVSTFLYAEAIAKDADEQSEKKQNCNDVSKVYFSQDGSTSSFYAYETTEEINELIRIAEDERAKRIIKTRLGIGIF